MRSFLITARAYVVRSYIRGLHPSASSCMCSMKEHAILSAGRKKECFLFLDDLFNVTEKAKSQVCCVFVACVCVRENLPFPSSSFRPFFFHRNTLVDLLDSPSVGPFVCLFVSFFALPHNIQTFHLEPQQATLCLDGYYIVVLDSAATFAFNKN